MKDKLTIIHQKIRKIFSGSFSPHIWLDIKKFEVTNSKIKAGFIWIIALVIGVVLLVLGFKPHGHAKDIDKFHDLDSSMPVANFRSELAKNLAYLHNMQGKVLLAQQAVNKSMHDLVPVQLNGHKQFSEQIHVRMNAPSTVYEAPISSVSSNNNKLFHRTQILLDNSDNASFANKLVEATPVEAQQLQHPDYTIAEGEFLPAILETAINSDLPGLVRAVVTEPVYAYTGPRLLVPAGSRLIGQYSSTVLQGQNRVMVIWNRMILPSGITAQIESPNVDALGQAGQGADHINTHFLSRFGGAVLISILSAGAANFNVDKADPYNSIAAYRQAVSESLAQSASQSLQSTLAIKPTLSIHQGAAINVFVAHDISFYEILKK